jgi:hypothetical protein
MFNYNQHVIHVHTRQTGQTDHVCVSYASENYTVDSYSIDLSSV